MSRVSSLKSNPRRKMPKITFSSAAAVTRHTKRYIGILCLEIFLWFLCKVFAVWLFDSVALLSQHGDGKKCCGFLNRGRAIEREGESSRWMAIYLFCYEMCHCHINYAAVNASVAAFFAGWLIWVIRRSWLTHVWTFADCPPFTIAISISIRNSIKLACSLSISHLFRRRMAVINLLEI